MWSLHDGPVMAFSIHLEIYFFSVAEAIFTFKHPFTRLTLYSLSIHILVLKTIKNY